MYDVAGGGSKIWDAHVLVRVTMKEKSLVL